MNILLILEDDIGYEQWLRFARGSNYAATPQVDAWFDGGVRFTNFRVEQLCTPTRIALHTGMHPSDTLEGDLCRGPLQSESSLDRIGMPEGLPNIPLELKRAGFATAIFGKYHMAQEFNGGLDAPNRAGYDRASVNLFNLQQFVESYYDYDKDTDGVVRRENEYHTDVTTREAAEWIRGRGKQPWFACVNTYGCHIPLLTTGVPPSGTFDPSWNTATSNGVFKACQESTDFYIARLWAAIPDAVKADTVLVWFTDNGSPGSQLALAVDPLTGTNYPINIGKDSPYDFGVRVPLIFYGAGMVSPGRTVANLASVVDLFPTLLDLAGVAIPDGLRGVSLKPYLYNTSSAQVHEYTYSEQFIPNGATSDAEKLQNMWSVTSTDALALVYRRDFGDPPATLEFYDLTADPHQLTNLTPLGSVAGLSASQRARFNAMLAYRTTTLGFI